VNDRQRRDEPSSEEFARIAEGFDAAAAGMISGAAVWLRRIKWSVLAFLALVILAYISEDVWLRWNIHSGRQAFDSITVTRYYAIHKKNGKVEYDSDAPVAETCVNAGFPHFGMKPCWYLKRNRHPVVDM